MALKPNDITARNSLTLALNFARQGDFAAHQRRAIEIAQGTLKLTPVGSAEWAMTENKSRQRLAEPSHGGQRRKS